MNLVAARLQGRVDYDGGASRLRTKVRDLHLEFLDGIRRGPEGHVSPSQISSLNPVEQVADILFPHSNSAERARRSASLIS